MRHSGSSLSILQGVICDCSLGCQITGGFRSNCAVGVDESIKYYLCLTTQLSASRHLSLAWSTGDAEEEESGEGWEYTRITIMSENGPANSAVSFIIKLGCNTVWSGSYFHLHYLEEVTVCPVPCDLLSCFKISHFPPPTYLIWRTLGSFHSNPEFLSPCRLYNAKGLS